jgi:hypothetical protein
MAESDRCPQCGSLRPPGANHDVGGVRRIIKSFPPSQLSNRKEFDLAGPFLRCTRGPDEKQALDDR